MCWLAKVPLNDGMLLGERPGSHCFVVVRNQQGSGPSSWRPCPRDSDLLVEALDLDQIGKGHEVLPVGGRVAIALPTTLIAGCHQISYLKKGRESMRQGVTTMRPMATL